MATDQAARHAGHGSRTRARGPGVCEPGHRITNTDRPGTQTQTRPGSSCATRQPPAAAARPGRPAATRQRSAATGTRSRQRGPGSGRQRITAAAAVNQAANNCACCSNQAANNCKPGSAAHGPGSHRQQLQGANQAAAAHRYALHVSRVQWPGPRAKRRRPAGPWVSRHKPASPWVAGAIPGTKKPGTRPGLCITKTAQLRQAGQQLQPGWPASGRPCPGRRPYRL